MNQIKKITGKIAPFYVFILSVLLLIALLIFTVVLLVAHLQEDVEVGISGRIDLDYRVFYLKNDFFQENPIPDDVTYLMAFTDYVEVDTRFSAQFDRDVEVFYRYDSAQQLVIRYMGVKDGVSNPIVLIETQPHSSIQGSAFTGELILPPESKNDGYYTYTIHPKEYTDRYLDFVAKQQQLMQSENVIVQDFRGFSVELLIDFVYQVEIPEWGVSETVKEGYRMSLSTKVFTLAETGNNSQFYFNRTVNLSDPPPAITPLMVLIYGIALALGIYGLCKGIQRLQADENKHRQKVLSIIKKYGNEIVVSIDPIYLSAYERTEVNDFRTLLRLAINANKHIMCYHDSFRAEFAVAVDGNAYIYGVDYGKG